MFHVVVVVLLTAGLLVGCAPQGLPLKLKPYIHLRDAARDGLQFGAMVCLDPTYRDRAQCRALPLVTEQAKDVDEAALDAFEAQISQGEKIERLNRAVEIFTKALGWAAKFGLMP